MNKIFREHVTSIGFQLSLGKTQIAAIERIANRAWYDWDRPYYNRFVSAGHGLIARGLVDWVETETAKKQGRDNWKLTRAGELVFELLLEAGLVERFEAIKSIHEYLGRDPERN